MAARRQLEDAAPLQPDILQVAFTPCHDSVAAIAAEPAYRLNISSVYVQLDHDTSHINLLQDRYDYTKGVFRITAIGDTDAVGQTANSSLATPPLSTLSVETDFLTFQVFSNDSYLCDHLYPTRPDPDNLLIVPAGCLYGPGQVALGLGIPLNDTYNLGTLWTRIRLSDTSSPTREMACFEVLVSPYNASKWYWELILWFPIALAIGYLLVVSAARIMSAITFRAKTFRHKAREGSQPNVIRDTIAPTIVASLSGQQLASSASLLRFTTPGCWDIIMHTQFVAALAMIAVRWPAFAYPFFQRAAWASLVGNTTVVRSGDASGGTGLLATQTTLPAGDIGAQFANTASPLYMNESQPNVFLNLDGAKSGIEAFARAIGLRPKDLFGTCVAMWLIIVAAVVAVSAVAWTIDSVHDTLLRFQKRKEDGADLALQLDGPVRSKETTDLHDEGVARSSLSRTRGGYRFLGKPGRSLFGSSNNSIHLKMLHGNLARAVFLFHLPITIFATYNMSNPGRFSLTSVALAAVAFAFLSVLIPAYLVLRISRTPTAKLYDSIGAFGALGPIYNTYSPGSQLFCAIDFIHSLVLGVVIGAGQSSGTAQALIILVSEVLFALGASLWLPWGDGAAMGPISFVASVLRIITAVLVLLLSSLVNFGREPVGWLTYVILLIQGILYVCAALILLVKIVEGLVRVFGRVPFHERASARSSGLGGACRELRRRKDAIQLSKPRRLSRQALNRSGSTNTQTLMLANAAQPGSRAGLPASDPSSPGQVHSSLPSSTSKIPMHSRQTSYASYLDGQHHGRKSPADYLNDTSGPYSTYFRGDPHDDGIIMAAMPSQIATNPSNPSWAPGTGAGRPASPPAAAGFVRTGGGKASDASPYRAVSVDPSSATAGPNARAGLSASLSRQKLRSLSQGTAVDDYSDRPRSIASPPANRPTDLSSTQAAAQYASSGYPSSKVAGESKKKFWQRRSGAHTEDSSDDDDDDDDDFGGAGRGPSRSQGAWRGLGKMSAALGALSLAFGGITDKDGADKDRPDVMLDSAPDDATESKGFEVVRPQRPRRSSAAAEQALDSTALAAATATATATASASASASAYTGPTANLTSHRSDNATTRTEMAGSASALSRTLSGRSYDPESGTLPPGAGQQALLLPHHAPASRFRQGGAQPLPKHPESGGEDAFWVDSQRDQSGHSQQSKTNGNDSYTETDARCERRDVSGASSFHTVSTLGRLAQPMAAEVFESVDDLLARTPSTGGGDDDGNKRSSLLPTINFDRPAFVQGQSTAIPPPLGPGPLGPSVASRNNGEERTTAATAATAQPTQFWDSAQAYGRAR